MRSEFIDETYPPDVRAFVTSELRLGSYRSEQAIIEAALKLLAANPAKASVLGPVASGDGFYCLDRAWRITTINDAALHYLGTTRDEALGASLWELAPGLVGTHCEEHYRLAMNGEPQEFIGPSAVRAGRWLEARMFPSATGLEVILRDVTERVESERALQESETRFRTLAEVVPAFVWFGTPDGQLHYLNSRWYEYTGQTPDEALPHGWTNALHPEDAERTAVVWADARARGVTYEIEVRYRRRDGDYRWYVARAEPVRNASGEITEWFGTSSDIHDRKLAEAELQRLNSQLAADVAERTRERDRIWSASRDLMLIARADGTILSANPAWERLLGWSADWLQGRNIAEIKHPDDVESTGLGLAHLATADPAASIEERYRHSDGSWRWISWTAEPDGEFVYCVGRDITADKAAQAALKQVEEARREADALYRAYFENTAEALFVVGVEPNERFLVEQMNAAHQALMGMRIEDVRGSYIDEILPPEVATKVAAAYSEAVRRRQVYAFRDEFELEGGVQYWDTMLVPMADAEGRIVRLVGSGRNITPQIAAEEALRQAQKMQSLGQLAGGIAHDFNNLLGAIVGSLDLVLRLGELDARSQRQVEGALNAAERGARLTAQLLAFSRAQRIELRPLSVNDVVAAAQELLARTLGPQVELQLDLRPEPLVVLSDATQLELAILNLAINARDAMPGGGQLTIAAGARRLSGDNELPAGDYVELAVSDTGSGMAPDVAARALDPFFTTKGVGKGTGLGLGLSPVYGIARQSAGTVRLETDMGRGTTVKILLPKADAPVAEVRNQQGPPASLQRTNASILVADDDPDMRRVLVDGLDALGYDVIEAVDGPSALAAFSSEIDLVILDFAMPGMNGAEVARAIRRRRPSCPVAFVSGFSDTAAIHEAVGADVVMLRKPFRIDELQMLVENAIKDSGSVRSITFAPNGVA